MRDPNAKSPAFQFYAKDFITDADVVTMSNEVLGMYIRLLCYDWIQDGFSASAILKIGQFEWQEHSKGIAKARKKEIEDFLISLFIPHPTRKGLITSPKLIEERQHQQENRDKRKKAGIKGAEKRWRNDSDELSDSNAIAMPLQTDSIEITNTIAKNGLSTSTSTALSRSNDLDRSSEPHKFENPNLCIREDIPSESGLVLTSTLPTTKSESKLPTTKKIPGYREGAICGGEFGRVWLKPKELEKLKSHHDPALVASKIASLDAKIENGVPKYLKFKSHYATIRDWLAQERTIKHEHIHKQESKTAAQKREFNEQAKLVETQITQREREEYLRAMEAEQ